MGHSDTVTVDETKWTHPAVQRDARRRLRLRPRHRRRQGQPHRGADDDAAAEAAERAARPRRDLRVGSRRGRRLRRRHRLHGEGALSARSTRSTASPKAAASRASAAQVKYATVQTLEKIPRGIELVSHGISGHGSIPLKSNAIVHLAGAVAKVGDWRPDDPLQRNHRHLLPQAGGDLAAGGREVLPRRAVDRSEGAAAPPTTGCSRTSRGTRRCCGPRCRRTSSPAATART